MSKVLVTGGAGFIGSHICDALLSDGHELHVIDNLSSGLVENVSSKVVLHQIDICAPAARNLLLEIQPQVIVHAAAQISVRESMYNPHNDVQVNVLGLINLLSSYGTEKPKCPYFIFLSTGGAIYGEQDNFPADETHAARPNSIYGQSKRVAEIYLEFWKRELGMQYCALRLANVYGPRQNPHGEAGVVAIFAEKLLKKQVPVINGSGAQSRDFVYVLDVAQAVKQLCKLNASGKPVSGTFNIGTSVETSVNELTRLIYNAFSQDFKPSYGPAKIGEQQRSCIDASLALKTFGWKPSKDIALGIQETCAWFRNKKSGNA